MKQKLVFPFKLEEFEIFPGLIQRRDEVFNAKVDFNLYFNNFYKYYLSQIHSVISSLSFQEIRKIKVLCGIHISVDANNTAQQLTKVICNDMLSLIINLTSKNTSYELLEHIRCNIHELPTFLLDIIKFINSHRLTTYIEGSGSSAFAWDTININVDSKELVECKTNEYKSTSVLVKYRRLVEIFKELKIDSISTINNMTELFEDDKHQLNFSVDYELNDEMHFKRLNIRAGRGMNKEDTIMAILTLPKYNIDVEDIIQYREVKLSNNMVNDMLQLPIAVFNDNNLNYTANDTLVNLYLDNKLVNQTNKNVGFDGFTSKDKPLTKVKGKKFSKVSSKKHNVSKELDEINKEVVDANTKDTNISEQSSSDE